MRKLITRVLVTVMLDGARTDIQPGEPLPEGVHEHDIEQLLKMRAIEDVAATAKAETNRAKDAQAASKDFEDARAAVQAGRESIEPVALNGGDGNPEGGGPDTPPGTPPVVQPETPVVPPETPVVPPETPAVVPPKTGARPTASGKGKAPVQGKK